MNRWKRLFESNRWLGGMAAVIAAVCNDVFGLGIPQETVLSCLGVVASVILGSTFRKTGDGPSS